MRELADRFAVSLSFLRELRRRVRESATAAPKAHGGGARRRLDAAGEERLRKLWAEDPDATIAQLCVRYVKRHRLPLSPATVGRTRKKSHSMRPNRAPNG